MRGRESQAASTQNNIRRVSLQRARRGRLACWDRASTSLYSVRASHPPRQEFAVSDVSLPDSVDAELLSPLVRASTSLPHAEVVDWTSRPLQGGSVGAVFLLEGVTRPSPDDDALVEWSLVLKVQRQWARPNDPESWRRELLIRPGG